MADLDVPIKNTTNVDDPNIFYLHKFIDQQITKFNHDQDYHLE